MSLDANPAARLKASQNSFIEYAFWGAVAVALLALFQALEKSNAMNWMLEAGAGAVAVLLYRVKGQAGTNTYAQVEAAATMAIVPSDFSVFDALPLPTIMVDTQSKILQTNRAASREFGELLIGNFLTLKFREPEMIAAFNQAAAQDAPVNFEMHERVPFERWYRVDICPIHKVDQPTRRYAILFRDISEAHNIERMRADFVANASHELRTPLASLTGFIETLRGPARNDEPAREKFLGIMQEQAGRMSRLIDDLLSLSRLEMRPNADKTEIIDITALTSQVIDALCPMAQDSGVEIERKFGMEPVRISAVRDELIQVLENLIENACKYGKSGGKVAVSIDVPESGGGKEVVISVRDFGTGIAAEHIPRLTERFYRATPNTGAVQKGTGLGLAIVKHIVSRHKGRLVIQSKPENGSIFAVHLPVGDK
jgi:two-component system, OmpR family, phosphate regulon sensor histidine kinase PhoR